MADTSTSHSPRTVASSEEFWRRFGTEPQVDGLSVLDLGCGAGAMAVRAARHGARRVVGVDLNPDAVRRARQVLAASHPDLTDRVEFHHAEASTLDETFDVVLSKDTFEHVEDLDGLLVELHRLLRPGGRLWAGFSPLYYSPFGDHGRTRLWVPWAHAVLPRSWTLRWARWRRRDSSIRSLLDLGLNGHVPAEFHGAFDSSPLEVESIAHNRGGKPLLRVLSVARRWARLERFCTVSIYAVLRRPC